MEGVRYMSLGDDLMNHKTNDLFYAYLISIADYKKEENKLFLDYDYYLEDEIQNELIKICEYDCRKSLSRCLKSYIDNGLITIEQVKWMGRKEKSLVFKNDFDKYQTVNNDVLEYLYKTSNRNCIRLYVYLLNKFKYYKSLERNYIFSYKELSMVMGYKAGRPSNSVIKNIQTILDCFMRQEIIDYKKIIVGNDNSPIGYACYMELTKVAEKVSDMRKVEPKIEYRRKGRI